MSLLLSFDLAVNIPEYMESSKHLMFYFLIFFVLIIPNLSKNLCEQMIINSSKEKKKYDMYGLKLFVNSILMVYMDNYQDETKKLYLQGMVKNHFTYCKKSYCFCKKKALFNAEDSKMVEVSDR